jgi:hypothetical protein
MAGVSGLARTEGDVFVCVLYVSVLSVFSCNDISNFIFLLKRKYTVIVSVEGEIEKVDSCIERGGSKGETRELCMESRINFFLSSRSVKKSETR